MNWGSHTWSIQAALSSALFAGDREGAAKAQVELDAYRATCGHLEHPEKAAQCLFCGADLVRPGLARTVAPSVVKKASHG